MFDMKYEEYAESYPESYAESHLKAKGLRYECNDMGNVERFVDQHGKEVKYIEEYRRWAVWDGARWTMDTPKIYAKASNTMKEIYNEARDCEDTQGRNELTKHAARSRSRNAIENMLSLCAKVLSVKVEKFDTDPLKINCLNGIVDLRSGELTPHSPDQYVMKCANVNYDPAAKNDVWLRFLNDVACGDQELINFMQRVLGYTLTGLTTEQCLFLAYGTGANGKTKLFETLLHLLGDYAKAVEMDVFLSSDKANVRTQEMIGKLNGLRCAIASETDSTKNFSEALIKRLTGGDTLTGAKLRGDSYDFTPTHKIFLQANHLPGAKDATKGFWRRPIVIPFNAVFEGEKKDKEMGYKLLAEKEGVFAWMVQGAIQYLEDKSLGDLPKVCKEAMDQYREENDILGLFIRENLIKARGESIPASHMIERYEKWCKDQDGVEPIQSKWLKRAFKERDIKCARGAKGWQYINYAFNDDLKVTVSRFISDTIERKDGRELDEETITDQLRRWCDREKVRLPGVDEMRGCLEALGLKRQGTCYTGIGLQAGVLV